MHSLSVSGGAMAGLSLSGGAPPSPLLEAYHGTYQSISPMPSPLLLASHSQLDIMEPLSPLSSSDDDRAPRRKARRARFHDPSDDAVTLSKALRGEKHGPDTDPLIEILPGLSHDQILDLRAEYKKLVKTGPERKGVNIAKHIKSRLKDEDPSLMKACYACALGRWESEAYWANFWYQGEKSRRELLIESLMGRTNAEIRAIKEGFSDKKYSDSLSKCMRVELKEDKFKKAVLMVLDERRMEERGRVDREAVERDVHELRRALKTEKGGESAMIAVIVLGSDSHLRECLKVYEATYRANFAREMLKKSGNLVVCLLHYLMPLFIFLCKPTPLDTSLSLFPLLFIASTHTQWPGRAPSPHPQRRHQPPRPRCSSPPPSNQPLRQRGEREPTYRAAHLAPCALPLGPPAHGGRQARVQGALRPRLAGGREGEYEGPVGEVL